MGIIKKLREKWDNWYYRDIEDEAGEVEWEPIREDQEEAYFADADQRTVYVLECLGQMAESAKRVEQYSDEYNAVTSLLMDMEEIENLPGDVRGQIMEQAQKIEMLEKERRLVYHQSGQLKESTVRLLERYEDEVPDGIRKIKEAEAYRKLVKQDLKKLNGERNSCRYQIKEAKTITANSRGIAMICSFAMIVCIVFLFILQMVYKMDVRIGYLITCGAGAITLTILYLRYMDAGKEQKKLAKMLNKLITLHNTVKIRYINNTNLLSYLYMKYEVESFEELEENWNLFVDEMGARQKDEKLKEDLEYYYDKLTKALAKYRVKDPEIWTHQANALIDSREMVEVRHALIGRRQKLREQIEYNKKIAGTAQEDIKNLAEKYPKYSAEIAALVKQYDEKTTI